MAAHLWSPSLTWTSIPCLRQPTCYVRNPSSTQLTQLFWLANVWPCEEHQSILKSPINNNDLLLTSVIRSHSMVFAVQRPYSANDAKWLIIFTSQQTCSEKALVILISTAFISFLWVAYLIQLYNNLGVMSTCSAGFYRLRQLRRVRWSLDSESAATLVHAFVTSRIDYCNVLLAGARKATTDTLQRLLNAAARLVSDTGKFDRCLRQLMHVDHSTYWLDVPERVKFKLVSMAQKCLYHKAPVAASSAPRLGI